MPVWALQLIGYLLPILVKMFGDEISEWHTITSAEAAYDKKVEDAKSSYKRAQTDEEKDRAFENLISSARRH